MRGARRGVSVRAPLFFCPIVLKAEVQRISRFRVCRKKTGLGFDAMHDVRTQQNTSGQLQQPQKIRQFRDLANEVADDFNNILTIIIGACTLLEMNGGDNPEQMEYVARIRSNADRAASLAQSLLELGGNQQIVAAPENLGEVIRGILCSLARIIGNDFNFSLELSERELLVMIDRGQIEAFFMNLLVNFRAATGSADLLRIVLSRVGNYGSLPELAGHESGDYALVAISDSCVEMDRDALRRVFAPCPTTRITEGEGGLEFTASPGAVGQHGGAVHVRSRAPHGTAFKIYLPLCIQDESGPR